MLEYYFFTPIITSTITDPALTLASVEGTQGDRIFFTVHEEKLEDPAETYSALAKVEGGLITAWRILPCLYGMPTEVAYWRN